MDIIVNGKIVGEISGDTYTTLRNSTKHFFRKRQGYPISTAVLKTLKENQVKIIRIIEERKDGSTKQYECFVSDFDFVESFKEPDFDEQKCIPLRRMKAL